jgi:hypothetical protein
MNEGTGSTAYDKSGYNNNGTIYGAVWANGRHGKCLSFDGADDCVNCGNSTVFDLTNTLTVMAWVYRAGAWSESYIVDKRVGGATPAVNYTLCYWYGLKFIVADASTYNSANDLSPSIGVWTHYAGVLDASYVKLYKNGSLLTQMARTVGTLQTSTNPLVVGRYGASPSLAWNGLISAVHIYNRVLSADEIKAHYLGGRVLKQRTLAVQR